jgi:hypothetical protein
MSPSSRLTSLTAVAVLAISTVSTASAAAVPAARSSEGHVLTLTQKVARPPAKASAIRDLTRKGGKGIKSHTATLAGADQDEEYLTNVTIGGQHFSLIVGG